MDKVKQVIPESILKILRNLRASYFTFLDEKRPYLDKINYCGFSLYYTRGQGLINRIRFGSPNRIYEEDLSRKIVSLLENKENPLLIDVGCNIGLVSIYVLSKIKNCKIIAFEPGPHQSKLFGITILANQLDERISLNMKALSNETGVITFNVHKNLEDCAGDSIINTHRGGETKEVKVESIKFDDFVKNNAIPSTENCVMKLDTEGAELLVLKGAREFILEHRPIIILEITNLNILNYNYTAADIFNLLVELGYTVKTLDEESEMTRDNTETLVAKTDSFIALPRSRQS